VRPRTRRVLCALSGKQTASLLPLQPVRLRSLSDADAGNHNQAAAVKRAVEFLFGESRQVWPSLDASAAVSPTSRRIPAGKFAATVRSLVYLHPLVAVSAPILPGIHAARAWTEERAMHCSGLLSGVMQLLCGEDLNEAFQGVPPC
jgi:hypothetical protein